MLTRKLLWVRWGPWQIQSKKQLTTKRRRHTVVQLIWTASWLEFQLQLPRMPNAAMQCSKNAQADNKKTHSYRDRYRYIYRKAELELELELELWCGTTNVRMRRAASLIISNQGRQRLRRDGKEGDDDDDDDGSRKSQFLMKIFCIGIYLLCVCKLQATSKQKIGEDDEDAWHFKLEPQLRLSILLAIQV